MIELVLGIYCNNLTKMIIKMNMMKNVHKFQSVCDTLNFMLDSPPISYVNRMQKGILTNPDTLNSLM